MDKFGIFNLLNSFLNLNGNNQQPNTNNESTSPQPENNGLNALFSAIKGDNNAKTKPSATTQTISKPLQSDMLKTMTNHDEFVRRVKSKLPVK